MTLKQTGLGAFAALAYCTSNVFALQISEVESNDSVATAQDIKGFFSTEFSPDIGDAQPGVNNSTTIPHVTINGFRNLTDSDFFTFAVNEGSRGIFDIDYAADRGHDTRLQLFTSGGELLAENDLFYPEAGAGGSTNPRDPFIQYNFALAGDYVIGVVNSIPGPYSGTYVLQVSLSDPLVASGVPDAGSTLSFMGIGMLGIVGLGRRLALAKRVHTTGVTLSC